MSSSQMISCVDRPEMCARWDLSARSKAAISSSFFSSDCLPKKRRTFAWRSAISRSFAARCLDALDSEAAASSALRVLSSWAVEDSESGCHSDESRRLLSLRSLSTNSYQCLVRRHW